MRRNSNLGLILRIADRTGGFIYKASGVFCVTLTAMMVAVALMGVIFRYVMLNPFEWTEELARFLFLGVGHIAINIGVRKEMHLTIDIAVKALPRYLQLPLAYAADILCGFFLIVLFFKGYQMATKTMLTAASMNISMFWPYAVVPLGALLATLQIFLNMVKKTVLLLLHESTAPDEAL